MKKEAISHTIDLGDGRTITLETGKLAKQADGSVVVRMGNCMLLATVVSSTEAKEGTDFLPLTVDYLEKFAAAGRIPGGYLKREGRPSDHEILISRLVDRALRPLFPDNYYNETQVLISLISADKDVMSDSLAALAASAAIAVSDVPFQGPISEVRVARIDGKFVINPSPENLQNSDIDIMLAASEDHVIMMEGEMKEVSEEDMLEAIQFGHEAIKEQCKAQKELVQKFGEKPKRALAETMEDADIKAKVEEIAKDRVSEVVRSKSAKHERSDKIKAIKEEVVASFGEDAEEQTIKLAKKYFSELQKKVVRDMILDDGVRLDGRKTDEIRSIWIETDYLPAAHGSAVFTRGETQSLTTVTFGNRRDEQMIDKVSGLEYSDFLLHYNFPPFSTGEAKFLRGTSRREIGHGNLALRALKQVLPEENPYTIRIVSDILESNGSSSMATVCAGSLALMDAGVKIARPVSGIAMGLIMGEDGKAAVLSDILGDEDHLGDMDFKVTGTEKGVTACQMDIKISGLSYDIMKKALQQANEGRKHILNKMNEALAEPREELKAHVPRLEKMEIDKKFIGAVIGSGGKTIQELQELTNTDITIEEEDNKGIVTISGSKEDIERAMERIKGLTTDPEPGEVYEGTVKNIMPYGAFVEFLPGKEGLLHISEISWKRLESMEGIFTEGDKVKVKLIEVDRRSGKFKLSRKALLEKPDFKTSEN